MPQEKPAENPAVALTTKDYAQLQHARVLLNCYAREVAMQEHNLAVRAIANTRFPPPALTQYQGQVLDIQLPRMHSRFCVGVRHVSVTGNYDYITDIYRQDQRHIWTLASWHDIAHLIVSDLSLRENTEFNSELLQQIEESIATMQHLLEAQQGRENPPHTAAPCCNTYTVNSTYSPGIPSIRHPKAVLAGPGSKKKLFAGTRCPVTTTLFPVASPLDHQR
jgi:hypothetical protein